MGDKWEATVEGACWKEHTCVCCGTVYRYLLKRRTSAEGTTEDEARARANTELVTLVRDEFEMVGCPGCGTIQPEMTAHWRSDRHSWTCLAAVILLLLVFALNALEVLPAGAAPVLCALVAALASAMHYVVETADPNRSLDANQVAFQQRAGTGQAQPVSPATIDPPSAPPLVAGGLGKSLGLSLGALVAISAALWLPALAGWRIDHSHQPPVIGPGDSARLYLGKKITSLKGLWRGKATYTVSPSDIPSSDVEVTTSNDEWGDNIRTSSGEKHQVTELWVDVKTKPLYALAGKTITLDVDMPIVYPSPEDARSFRETKEDFKTSVSLQLASLRAGQTYTWAWRGGCVVGLVLMVAATLAFLGRTDELKAKGNPVEIRTLDEVMA